MDNPHYPETYTSHNTNPYTPLTNPSTKPTEMKVGATEKTFLSAWHPDAENLFNVSSSLKRVCWELYDPNIRLDSAEKGVTLLSCFQPQLAQFQKRTLEHTVNLMHRGGSEQFWIEEKLDGERMQMHMNEGEFRWWSRKAKDYTYLYGAGEGPHTVDGSEEGEHELTGGGSLVRYLEDAFDPGVKRYIPCWPLWRVLMLRLHSPLTNLLLASSLMVR